MKTVALALVACAALGGCARSARAARVTPVTHPRGVSLGLFASDARYDYKTLLEEVAELGASDVMLVVPLAQAHADSAYPVAAVSVETVTRTLAQARALGLRTAVLPIIELRAAPAGQWRGQLRPEEGATVWFERYRAEVTALAVAAQRGGAVRFGIGSELASLEPYEHEWRALAAGVRGAFRGRVFYSVNWDGLDRPGFFDALDEVGVSAYFTLARRGEPTRVRDLVARWEPHRAGLRALAARAGRPVFLSEVGYPSVESAAERPWDDRSPEAVDLALQSRLHAAVCETFLAPRAPGAREVTGVYFWNWFGFGGPTDTGFTPRGKPSAATIGACLSGA